MAERLITSADSVFILASSDFALANFQVEGYAADAAWAFDNVDTAETVLGVDGKLSAGWVPRAHPMTITLQPDSPSLPIFAGIVGAQDAARTVFRLQGVLTLPGNQFSHSLNRGVLTSVTPIATGQRILQPMTFQIMWESKTSIPLA